jgi:uncharacterized membrane protein YfcA
MDGLPLTTEGLIMIHQLIQAFFGFGFLLLSLPIFFVMAPLNLAAAVMVWLCLVTASAISLNRAAGE